MASIVGAESTDRAAETSPGAASRFVEVALALPLFQTFTYAVEGEPAHPLVPGTRVVVPFRSRRVVGICVGGADAPPARGTPKPILDVPDATPVLDAPLMTLCQWMAEYYAVPLGVAVRSALPAALTGAAAPHPSRKTRRVAAIQGDVPSLLQREKLFGRSPRQRAAYEYLRVAGVV